MDEEITRTRKEKIIITISIDINTLYRHGFFIHMGKRIKGQEKLEICG